MKQFDLDEAVDAFTAITWWRSQHARPLTKVAANLRYHVAKESALVDDRIDVTQRLKRRVTMIDKLQREPTMELTQMHDIGGVRARLATLRHVYAVSRRLRKTWTIHRTRDYVAEPKASGYRALHHIVRRDGRMVEVQSAELPTRALGADPGSRTRALSCARWSGRRTPTSPALRAAPTSPPGRLRGPRVDLLAMAQTLHDRLDRERPA